MFIFFLYALLIILCLGISGFFSGSESGFYFVEKERLSILSNKGNLNAKKLLKVLENPADMISAILIGNNLVLQLATYIAMGCFDYYHWFQGNISAEVATTVILFFPFFLFGEVLPKVTFRLYAEPLLLKLTPILCFINLLLKPFTFLVLKVTSRLEKSFDVEKKADVIFDRNQLSRHFGHAYAGGVLSEDQVTSVMQALNSEEIFVERIMTPIRKANPVFIKDTLTDMSELYKKTHRFVHPVYANKKSDIIGVIDIKKLLQHSGKKPLVLKDYVEKPVKIEKGQPFNALFEIFFKQQEPIVFVHYHERIIGYINREDAILKLLR